MAFKKVFHLKQHTPLIHFQHEQSGATLRATEVKAKLDRFILDNYQKLKTLIPTNQAAINLLQNAVENKKGNLYKMRIVAPPSPPAYYFFKSGKIKSEDFNALNTSIN
ncbi:MAG: hypothetical protein AAGJ93_17980, partial [Bacteroidota bacterium]